MLFSMVFILGVVSCADWSDFIDMSVRESKSPVPVPAPLKLQLEGKIGSIYLLLFI